MIFTTNWIERLQRDFSRVLRMRRVIPTKEFLSVLLAKVPIDKKPYFKTLPGIDRDEVLSVDSCNFLDSLNNLLDWLPNPEYWAEKCIFKM